VFPQVANRLCRHILEPAANALRPQANPEPVFEMLGESAGNSQLLLLAILPRSLNTSK
jgi:hypothetical protein